MLFSPWKQQVKIPLCQIDLAQTISEWKDVQSNKEDDQYLGDICFSLRYVPTSGKLTVGILECKRLKKMDITGASGTFMKIHVIFYWFLAVSKQTLLAAPHKTRSRI